MPFIALIIGGILIVVAFQGTHTRLATELEHDIPGFFKWAIAIIAVLGLGYIPGLREPSRWLLGLVVLVIVLTQYQNIINGFKNFAATGQQTATAAAASEQQSATAAAAQATQAQTAMAQLGSGTSSSTAAGTPAGFGSIGQAADLLGMAAMFA